MKKSGGILTLTITILLVILPGLSARGNFPDSTDANNQIDKLQKDLLKPEIAMIAATKLLEMKKKEAFEVVEKSFVSASPKVKIQIIRAFRFKKDPRGLRLLMAHFSNSQTPLKVKEEIGKALQEFSNHKEVLEFLTSIITSQKSSYSLEAKKLALDTLTNTLRKLPPAVALSYYRRILKNNSYHSDIINRKIYLEVAKITGKRFKTFQEWQEWWKKNKDKSQLEWLREVKDKLEKRLEKTEDRVFHWWKKYMESIQSSNSSQYIKELIQALERDKYPQMTLYALNKLENNLNLSGPEKEKAVNVLIALLKDKGNSFQIRRQTVKVLGKICLNAPPELVQKASQILIEIFRNSMDEKLRILACNTLSTFKAPKALPIFLESLRSPKESLNVVQEVIRNLGAYQDGKDNEIIKAILRRLELTYGKDKTISKEVNHSELLALSIEKLSQFEYHNDQVLQESLMLLKQLLSHHSMKIRYFASNSLGKIGGSETIPPLLKALKDSESGVKRAIISAIYSISKDKEIPQDLSQKSIHQLAKCHQKKKLKKKVEKTIPLLVGNSLSLLEYAVNTYQRLASEAPQDLRDTYYKFIEKLLEKKLDPLKVKDLKKDPQREKTYWALRREQALNALYLGKYERAQKILSSLPKLTLRGQLQQVWALWGKKEVKGAREKLIKVEKRLSQSNFSRYQSLLLAIFTTAAQKTPREARELLERWKTSNLWTEEGKKKLEEIGAKHLPSEKTKKEKDTPSQNGEKSDKSKKIK